MGATTGEPLSLSNYAYRSLSLPGLTGDETSDVKAKSDGDWRWCPGLGAAERSMGWAPMVDGLAAPSVSITRAAVNNVGDQAELFETFTPKPLPHQHGEPLPSAVWLVTLTRASPADTWRIASRRDVTPASP